MPIISVEIMKTKDEREIQKTTKEKKIKSLKSNHFEAYIKILRIEARKFHFSKYKKFFWGGFFIFFFFFFFLFLGVKVR